MQPNDPLLCNLSDGRSTVDLFCFYLSILLIYASCVSSSEVCILHDSLNDYPELVLGRSVLKIDNWDISAKLPMNYWRICIH